MKSLGLKILVVGEMQTNCYLVFDKKSREAVIIDPGEDVDYIERVILERELKPLKIIATHGHFDHILGAFELRLAFKIPFLINKKDEFLVKSMKKRAEFFLETKDSLNTIIDGSLEEEDEVTVGEGKLTVIETSGHTPGSISFWNKKEKIVFSGDLIFKDKTFGETGHKYSSLNKVLESISKIKSLPKGTTLYPGHGEEFKL